MSPHTLVLATTSSGGDAAAPDEDVVPDGEGAGDGDELQPAVTPMAAAMAMTMNLTLARPVTKLLRCS
jgi:hypothetical protein